jgi:hypothetical protein
VSALPHKNDASVANGQIFMTWAVCEHWRYENLPQFEKEVEQVEALMREFRKGETEQPFDKGKQL